MSPQDILNRIQRELSLVMGPLAPVIMKHKAAEFGTSLAEFPLDRMPELVEEVSFEIQNHRRKVQFQREALKILRDAPVLPVVPKEEESPEPEQKQEGLPRRKVRLRLAKD